MRNDGRIMYKVCYHDSAGEMYRIQYQCYNRSIFTLQNALLRYDAHPGATELVRRGQNWEIVHQQTAVSASMTTQEY